MKPFVLGICATRSDMGKTTLLVRLIPQLRAAGLRIAVIKHAHHQFDIDHPGKDSYRLREAGAVQTLVASRQRWALMTETPQAGADPDLEVLLAQLDTNHIDLVLVEGMRRAPIPKLEVFRADNPDELLALHDPSIIAVAAPTPITAPCPCLPLNDTAAMVAWVLAFTGHDRP